MSQQMTDRFAIMSAFGNYLQRWWPAGLLTVAVSAALAGAGDYYLSPHGSQTTGVLRVNDYPRGSCAQCHSSHDDGNAQPYGLFRENSNELCFSASLGGCHADRPAGASSGYPAQESDRMPVGSADPGYFEYNAGGVRTPGLNNLVRWPGRSIWEDALSSTHYADPDMPIKDVYGRGACDNCHDVHGGSSLHDMLDSTHLGIVGSQLGTAADNFTLCLSCHNVNGPTGMDDASRNIAYYYDRSVNPGMSSGHGVTTGGGYVPSGARLPCYDCHNPHGSIGNAGAGPNGFLLSDERSGWAGLTAIRTDSVQARRFCFGCHRSSDMQFGGAVEGLTLAPLPSTVGAHQSSSTTHCYSCHGSDYTTPTSNNVHNPSPGGDCISCHSTTRAGRRPVVPEFGLASHHGIRIGQNGTITNRDCIVCHAEGSPANGSPDQTYHANGQVDLRNPDTGFPLPGFLSFTRELSSSFLEPWVTDVQNQFCLKCHDADGAVSPLAQVPGGSALAPFSDPQATVINVAAQFAAGNTTSHPVVVRGVNPYTIPSSANNFTPLMLPPFNQTTHDLISCFDCHETSGHGSVNSGMLLEETYFREVTPNPNFATSQRNFCGRCHDINVYTNNAQNSRFPEHTEGPHNSPSGSGQNTMACRGCHAGIYDTDQLPACDNNSGIGRIHGYSFTYPSCAATPGTQPPRFLTGGYLKGWRVKNASNNTCFANCHHPNGEDY
ncbi:MAG: hypothetical protein AB1644_07970 [Candidatus Zixiibacteriota bacterium]